MPYRKGLEYWCVLVLATRYGFHTMTGFAHPRHDCTESEFNSDLVAIAFSNFGIPAGTEFNTVYVSVSEERA